MSEQKKLSTTYKLMRVIGLNYSEEEYGQVSLFKVIGKFFHNIWVKRLEMMMDWPILQPIAPRKMRAILLRKMGCHVCKNVFVGEYVHFDIWHAELIYIDDYAHIASGCRLLCHQRDLSNYCVGDNVANLKYRKGKIHIGRGALLGMETMVMPGVTIGDGAIIGARSLVTKDIPPYTIAVGSPAKVVKQFSEREIK